MRKRCLCLSCVSPAGSRRVTDRTQSRTSEAFCLLVARCLSTFSPVWTQVVNTHRNGYNEPCAELKHWHLHD